MYLESPVTVAMRPSRDWPSWAMTKRRLGGPTSKQRRISALSFAAEDGITPALHSILGYTPFTLTHPEAWSLIASRNGPLYVKGKADGRLSTGPACIGLSA